MPERRFGAILDRPGPDRRAALRSAGANALRIPARWPELQPRQGQWDGQAIEQLRVEAADATAVGLEPWLALLGRRVPGWFDDEGGFGDAKNAGRWWPRFVDGLATELGDNVGGWFPMIDPAGFATLAFADLDPQAAFNGYRTLLVAWRDAWRILRGGPPVAAALALRPWDARWLRALRTGEPTETALEIEDLGGSCDLLGGIFRADATSTVDEPAELLVRLAEDGPERPLVVLLTLAGDNDDQRATAADRAGGAVRAVIGDGLDIAGVFADGLLSDDGAPAPAAEVLASLG
jgi:hypothetical protein